MLVEAGPTYVRASERRGLSAAQTQLLLALREAGSPLTLAALAERTERSVSSVRRLAERLRGNELVRGSDGTDERRGRRVELTESGHAHLCALQTDQRKRLEHYVGTMGASQRLRLAGALHLLSHRLDEDLAHPDLRAAHAA